MPIDFDADLALMLDGEFADTLAFGAQSVTGLFDDRTERFVSEDGLDVRKRAASLTTSAAKLAALAPPLAVDAAVTVRGVAYRVRDVAPPESGDDGRTRVVVLARVS